jgi:tetratricopeptide (TPR) repeat protein
VNKIKSGIIAGLTITISILPVGNTLGEDDTGIGATSGFSQYPDILREKVGEVSEIRYKELVESNSDRGDNEKALMRLALYKYFQGDFAGSEFYLRRLIERYGETDPGREARIWLGRTYLARGEYRSALVEWRTGLEELVDAPRSGEDLTGLYLFWIGEGYRQSGMAADARHYFESFLQRVPGHPLTSLLMERLAETYQALGIDPSSIRIDRSPAEKAPVEVENEVKMAVSTPGSFRIRIASFSVRENASALVRTLGEKGFRAETEEATLDTGRYYRVVMKGFDDRDRAEEIADRVRREGYSKAYVEEE